MNLNTQSSARAISNLTTDYHPVERTQVTSTVLAVASMKPSGSFEESKLHGSKIRSFIFLRVRGTES